MGRKKKKKGLRNLDFSRPKLDISDDTRQSIAAVLLILFGIISILSLVDLAGTIGVYFDNMLSLLLGGFRWLGPILLVLTGYFLLRPAKYEVKFSNYLGLFLVLFCLPGLIHLIGYNEVLVEAARAGQGGGYIGLTFSYIFFMLMGFWASLLVIIALLLIGLFLLFNTSFADLSEKSGRLSFLWQWFGGDKEQRKIDKAQKEREKNFDDDSDFESSDIEDDEEYEDDEEEDDEGEEDDEEYEEDEDDEEDAGARLPAPEGAANVGQVMKFKQVKIDMPLSLLTGKTGVPNGGDLEANKLIIKRTLENFGIKAQMGDSQVGPTVTQYTLKPSEGVKLSKITALNDNLALALAAHPIRIEAPIPGRSFIGIEVPNATKAIVPMRDLLISDDFKKRSSNLMLGLGKDVMGKPWLYDLKKMPHLLIAGSTGSGKSVMINSLIISLLYQNGPGDLKFIMVDPKRVELPMYNGIPHLLTPVITDVKKTVNALRWTVAEMERRFELLSQAHKRNLESYNAAMPEKIPYIVFVIDELADLMSTASAEVEAAIIRLAQMARAVGIHLVLATQRPSVNVITGLIKANVPARIAFSVASLIDSRTILDMAGAEKLLGRGDLLYMSAELGKPKRLQGAWTTDDEIKNIINHLKAKAKPEYIEEVTEKQSKGGSGLANDDGTSDEDADPLLGEAKEVIMQAKKASASLLQRRLRVGYARAARLLDLLEERGIIGPADGAKPREVFMNKLQESQAAPEPEEEEDEEEEESDYAEASSDEEEEDDDEYEEELEEDDPK